MTKLEAQARELVARLREHEKYPVEERWHVDLVLAFARRVRAEALGEVMAIFHAGLCPEGLCGQCDQWRGLAVEAEL